MPDAPTTVMERVRDIVAMYAWPDKPDTIRINIGGLILGDLRALLEVADAALGLRGIPVVRAQNPAQEFRASQEVKRRAASRFEAALSRVTHPEDHHGKL